MPPPDVSLLPVTFANLSEGDLILCNPVLWYGKNSKLVYQSIFLVLSIEAPRPRSADRGSPKSSMLQPVLQRRLRVVNLIVDREYIYTVYSDSMLASWQRLA
jgi:hypothetical protein